MTRNVTALVLSCLLALSVMAGTVHAQILGGNLIGGLEDAQGGVLPGVVVTLASPALDVPQTAVTDGTGGYRFIGLRPGTYQLTAALDGFATYVEEGLIVAVGGTIEVNVSMELATVAEMITVTGESPVVDPRRVGVIDNLELETLESIPMHRFYAMEYGKWTGGVSASNPSSISGSISVMGSGTNENSLLQDGVQVQNIRSGGGWATTDMDAAEEIQVITLGASAEYQMAQGGVFNLVYKSGTNQFRGDASTFYHPDFLLSEPTKVACGCPAGETGFNVRGWRMFNFHLGGPIIRDRLFFWAGGNLDKRKEHNPGTNPDPPFGRTWWYSDAIYGKVSANVTDNVRAKGSINYDYWGGQAEPTLQRPLETRTTGFGFLPTFMSEVTATLGSDTLLTLRATGWSDPYPTKALDEQTFSVTDPQRIDDDTGVRSAGWDLIAQNELSRWNQYVKINRFYQGANVSHDLRGGLQLEQGHEGRFVAAPGGMVFHDFAGAPNELVVIETDVKGAQSRAIGLWVEDALTFDRLTVNLGVRYDRMRGHSPDLIDVDDALVPNGVNIVGLGDMYTWNVVAPRLGLNYKLNEAGTAVMRATVGRAHRNIRTGEFVNGHPGRGTQTTRAWDGVTPLSAATSVAAYPTILRVTDPFSNLPLIDPNTDAPYTDSVSIGVDTEVAPQVGVGLSYIYKYGQKQIGEVDTGGTYAEGLATLGQGLTVPTFSRTSAAAATVTTTTNGPGTYMRYHGFILNIDKRMRDNWSANVAYTFSKAVGLEDTSSDPNKNTNRGGRIFEDRPHMIAAQGMYRFPWDVLLSSTYLGVSGSPFAREASVTLPQGLQKIAIEPANGDFRFPRQDIFSLRLSKRFVSDMNRNIEFGMEFQNILQNQAHNQISTQDFFSTSFRNPIRFIEPRRLNFFIRSVF
jgi:hypothetical protein